MSDTDSFIDEVTEEVRRDRLYGLLRKYGWIAVAVIFAIVGGASWSEYQKAQASRAAQDLGDQVIAAIALEDSTAQAQAFATMDPATPGGTAIARMLQAAALEEAGDTAGSVAALNAIATLGELPQIYRNIAAFKALTLQTGTLAVADRRIAFEALAQPGAPLRMLALEQLAMIEIETGQADAAIAAFTAILEDAEVTADLQQRARQAIVALGGTLPETAQNG